jgi:two-component system alkaline phosphatase synthesis response regulator PhoP
MSSRILIADDEPNILISLEYLMKREGYEVTWRATGRKRWTCCARDRHAWCCWT